MMTSCSVPTSTQASKRMNSSGDADDTKPKVEPGLHLEKTLILFLVEMDRFHTLRSLKRIRQSTVIQEWSSCVEWTRLFDRKRQVNGAKLSFFTTMRARAWQKVVKAVLQKLEWEHFSHSSRFPDLDPTDYHLFRWLAGETGHHYALQWTVPQDLVERIPQHQTWKFLGENRFSSITVLAHSFSDNHL